MKKLSILLSFLLTVGAFAQSTLTVNKSTGAITGPVSASTFKTINAIVGTGDTGTVTDTMLANAVKPAVTVVSTSNLTLSGEQTIDGQLTAASIVLCTAQSTGSQNGPWVTASGAWTRPPWYTNGSTTQAPRFLTTFVRLGTTYSGSTWRMTTASVTIGTTATTWVQTPISLDSANVTGTLSGSSVSGGTFGAVNGSALTALNATNLASGTLPDARFPATLPSIAGTNLSGTGASFTAGHVTTNANSTGDVTSSGNATTVANVPVTAAHPTDNTVLPTDTGGWTEYFVTGSDFTTSSASLVDITGLVSGTLSATTKYEFEAVLTAVNGADTNGLKVGIHGGGSGTAATVTAIVNATSSAASSGATASMTTIDFATVAFVTFSAGVGQINIKGFFTTNSVAPLTMSIQANKVTANSLTIKVGSVFRIRKAHI